MNQFFKALFIACLLLGTMLAVSGATESPPQLEIRSAGPGQVVLSWPASAEDFVLEETRRLSALGQWLPVTRTPTMGEEWYTVDMPCTEPIRFFRLRYEPSALRSTHPAISFSLVVPDGANVAAGQPFSIELRASFNAVLAAAALRISASGSAEAMLTGRSANPAQPNGLMFVSSTSQEPFESGLPVSLAGEGSVEVLLGGGLWPFDGALPGDDVLLERLEITPVANGDLTVSLVGVEAVTSRWARDGLFFDWVGINPWQSAVTVNVQGAGTGAGEGVRAASTMEAFSQREQPTQEITPNADGQGGVDLADLVYVRARLGLDPALPENAGADVNHDGKIDLLDLVAVRNRFTPPAGLGAWPAPLLNEVCPNPAAGEAPWVEICYPVWTEPYFYALELRDGAQEVLVGWWPEPISTWVSYIVIVFDGEQPMEYIGDPDAPTAVRVHLPPPGAVFNPASDQCLLYLEGELVDSVAWGRLPEGKAALNTELYPVPSGGSIGRDGYEQERWVRFSQCTPGAENGLPTPLAYFPFDGAGLLKEETTRFAWVDPRHAPVTYELEMDDADDFHNPLVHAGCPSARYDVSPGLATGKYFWRVRAIAGTLTSAWSPALSVEVLDLSPPPESRREAPQGASTLAGSGIVYYFFYGLKEELDTPQKDTSMICLECDQDRGWHAWDRPHEGSAICLHEIGHAGTAIARDMNIYYGQLLRRFLTQDEINFEIFHTPAAGPEGELGHGKVVDLGKALEVALAPKLVLPYYLNPHQSHIIWDNVKYLIDRQIPFVGQLTLKTGVALGTVILVGYYDDLPDPKMRRIVAMSPFSGDSKFIFSINDLPATPPIVYVPADPPDFSKPPQGGDPQVDADTDGDGLCDFDEEMRFPTERTKPDSDGDGIPDKTEVWSYKFGKGWVPRTADPDGDGLRAEIDPDSDDDGCPDGAEDRNRNGTLFDVSYIQTSSGIVGLKTKESDETDPFSEDEFKGTFSAERTVLHFKECTRLEVKLTDKEDRPVKDAEVELQMDPAIGSFDASGGTPVTTAIILTDADGKASSDFCACETEGTVTLTALYKPCPNSKGIKAELQIKIFPYDWVFAVQEKAVLTGPVMKEDYSVSILSQYEGIGENEVYKDEGLQKIAGHFYHPKTQTPGKYIESISVDIPAISPRPTVILRVNGTQMPGTTWNRTSDQDLPTRWEVEVASPGLEEFPRYLWVTTRGGPIRKTPLLWWYWCRITGQRRRWFEGHYYVSWDSTRNDYEVFFGDGDEYGRDPHGHIWPRPDPTWPQVEHSGVGFVPVAGVPGYKLGAREGSGDPRTTWGESGVCEGVSNFYNKEIITWIPASPWTRSYITPGEPRPNIEAELTNAGPMLLPEFLNDIRFKRDYIGDELKELQQRKLDAPQYEIRMRLQE